MATAPNVTIGKVYYFGWKNTPNTVIDVRAPHPSGDIPVTLRGPRGGEFRAVVLASTGKCMKI